MLRCSELAGGVMVVLGWVIALTLVSGAAYLLSDASNADNTTADGVGWAQLVFGLLFLLLAIRSWRARPAEGSEPEMPKWMAGIDSLGVGRALALGVLLAG